MSIRYSRQAMADLWAILQYGRESWPGTAEAFMDALRQRLESTLSSHPAAGKIGRVKGAQEWVLSGTPYIVVYAPPAPPSKPDLIVVRVLHGARLRQ